MALPYYKLHSGKPIPALGFGVYLVPPEDTAKAVEEALEVGYRSIDSAVFYNNEKEAGEGILRFLSKHPEVKREDIFYTSKIKSDNGLSEEEAEQAVEASLKRVAGLGYIDLYLDHSSHGGRSGRIGLYRGLLRAKARGLTKEVGVSNWGVHHLEELVGEAPLPAVNQVEINPWLQRLDIKEYCAKHHILVEAWAPLMRGISDRDDKLQPLANKYGKTVPQILLRWSYESGYRPICKTTHRDRMVEDFDIFDFDISAEDLAAIGDKNSYYVTNEQWDPTVLE